MANIIWKLIKVNLENYKINIIFNLKFYKLIRLNYYHNHKTIHIITVALIVYN